MIHHRVARCVGRYSPLVCVALLAAGCVMHDPPALTAIHQANNDIQAAKKAGAQDRFPDEYADLEKRYLLTRGTFYACQEAKALAMAQELSADAQALATKKVAMTREAPPPANQPPIAKLNVPAEGDLNALLTFQADESTDPDGDKLTYRWNFGDGQTASYSFGVGTHRYLQPGNYTVSLTIDDGRGGIDTATGMVTVVSRQVLRSDVLFDFNKATLKDEGVQELNTLVSTLQRDTWLHAELVGYTDSQGPEQYNLELSKKRAEAVAAYLESQGIAADRLSLAWKGEADPVAPNTTKAGRAQNRRTAVTLRPAAQ